jgi:hypothetical protein
MSAAARLPKKCLWIRATNELLQGHWYCDTAGDMLTLMLEYSCICCNLTVTRCGTLCACDLQRCTFILPPRNCLHELIGSVWSISHPDCDGLCGVHRHSKREAGKLPAAWSVGVIRDSLIGRTLPLLHWVVPRRTVAVSIVVCGKRAEHPCSEGRSMVGRRGRMLLAAVLLCAACCQVANASTGTGRHRTLVLIGEDGIRQTHSKYLAAVKALGSELDVRLSSDPKLQLRHWDDLLYETVILLHPEAKGEPEQKEVAAVVVRNGGCDAGILCHAKQPVMESSITFLHHLIVKDQRILCRVWWRGRLGCSGRVCGCRRQPAACTRQRRIRAGKARVRAPSYVAQVTIASTLINICELLAPVTPRTSPGAGACIRAGRGC